MCVCTCVCVCVHVCAAICPSRAMPRAAVLLCCRGKYLEVIPTGVTHLVFKKSGEHFTWTKVKRAPVCACLCVRVCACVCVCAAWLRGVRMLLALVFSPWCCVLLCSGSHNHPQHHCWIAVAGEHGDDGDYEPHDRRHVHPQVPPLLHLQQQPGTRDSSSSFTHTERERSREREVERERERETERGRERQTDTHTHKHIHTHSLTPVCSCTAWKAR